MEKRISSRGIVLRGDEVLTMFRRRIKDGKVKEYYVIPGGGIEEGETLVDNVIREMKEEFTIDVKVLGYLGKDEGEDSIANFFHCEIIGGEVKLGGEEKQRMSEENYYEPRYVKISELGNIDILGTDMIMKAVNKEYVELENN